MARLILLGGPTGVGKTTALKNLHDRAQGVALLDADDVWRVSKNLAIPANRHIAITNVVSVMRGYFEAGCQTGILSWVFARARLYQPVLDGLADLVDSTEMLYLISSPEALEARLLARGQPELLAYGLTRLELIEELSFPKLDTTDLSPTEVADQICTSIGLTAGAHA
jgi:ABC-type cobalamin/Fe3+-siderophores transport system ATPase subunit